MRTESMRAFRGSLNGKYAQMSRVIGGYRRSAAKGPRTCLYCLAMDGHVQDDPHDDWHVCDRCIDTPVPRGSTYQYESGEDWLRRQPEDVQRGMFPSVAAFREGKLVLRDFAGTRRDPIWGVSGFEKSGRQALLGAGLPENYGTQGQVSPVNAFAVRGPHGFWNEESLPITTWESPEHRVVLPRALQEHLGYHTPVLRWSAKKRTTVLREHSADAPVIDHLNDLLASVFRAGPDPRPNRGESLAFFWHDDRLYRVVMGTDNSGSTNVVTVYGTAKADVIRQWQRDMEGMRDVDQ